MELNEKTFRKWFLAAFDEAYHAVIEPEFKKIRADINELRADLNELRSDFEDHRVKTDQQFAVIRDELLNIKDHVYPTLAEIQLDLRALVQDVSKLINRANVNESNIKQTQSVVMILKKELIKLTARVSKFEERLKKLNQSAKKKVAR